MARIITFLLAFAVVGYGAWPYYRIFQLDRALSEPDAQAIAPFVDLSAIQQRYEERLESSIGTLLPADQRAAAPLLDRLAQGLQQAGTTALERTVGLDLVHGILREAAVRATDKRPAYFIAGIDYAFFSSWNRFLIRLGPPDGGTRVEMQLQGASWRLVDIHG